jgi:hypothetical protein
MRVIAIVGLLSAILFHTAAFATDNNVNNYLLSVSPKEQAAMLGKAAGEGCVGESAFNMGMMTTGPTRDIGNWSVTCTNGKSYSVGIYPDGSSKILDCSVLKAVAHVDCSKRLDAQ